MAIGTDSAIEFFGSKTLLGGTATAAVLNDAFSIINATTGLVAFTNTDDAPQATLALEFTTATTGDANSVINLYARLMNIGSADTEDAEVPDVNFQKDFLGSFAHNNPATGEQAVSIVVSLPNVSSQQVFEFYIENKTGQTISAGWELTIRPKTLGPHA
jgi:hypothetical protein